MIHSLSIILLHCLSMTIVCCLSSLKNVGSIIWFNQEEWFILLFEWVTEKRPALLLPASTRWNSPFVSCILYLRVLLSYKYDWYDLLLNTIRIAFEDIHCIVKNVGHLRRLVLLPQKHEYSLSLGQVFLQCIFKDFFFRLNQLSMKNVMLTIYGRLNSSSRDLSSFVSSLLAWPLLTILA